MAGNDDWLLRYDSDRSIEDDSNFKPTGNYEWKGAMADSYDVFGVGNALVDVLALVDDAFIDRKSVV